MIGIRSAIILLLTSLAITALPQGLVAQSLFQGRVEKHEPTMVTSSGPTSIQVTVRNMGGGGAYFRLRLLNAPGSWQVGTPTPSDVFIAHNKTGVFNITVHPNFTAGVGQLHVELQALATVNPDWPVYVHVSETTRDVESVHPPGQFFITEPAMDQQVDGPFFIAWSASNFADTYTVRIYELGDAGLIQPPITIEGITNTSLQYHTDNLVKGKQYEVFLTAVNRIATTDDQAGGRRFSVKPAALPGTFQITTPQAGQTLTREPVFQWTASSNAKDYTVSVLPEVDGNPSSSPVRQFQNVLGTSLVWSGEPLEGGRHYYLSVRANGEGGASNFRVNEGGPVRFFAAALEPFELGHPPNGAQNINRKTGFGWGKSQGATHYRLRIYDETSGGDQPTYDVTVPQPEQEVVGFFPHFTLMWDRVYRWRVDAVVGNQTRRNEGGDFTFRTSPVRPFSLIWPVANEMGVPRRPVFQWQHINQDVQYRVEVTPAAPDGTPMLPPFASTPRTANFWEYSAPLPLEAGRLYLWRVAAFDQHNEEFNWGNWLRFTVTPFEVDSFALFGPVNEGTDVSVRPLFTWEEVSGATGYVLRVARESGGGPAPIAIEGNTPRFSFAENGMHLNGETAYVWTVEAVGPGKVLPSGTARSFTTTQRNEVLSCDIVEHFLGIQKLSDRERAISGFLTPSDISLYVRFIQDPSNPHCSDAAEDAED